MKEIVNCVAYKNGIRKSELPLHRVHEELQDAEQFVWIGLHEPSPEVMRQVQEEFNLHDLAVEDAQKAHQRPKVELYGDILFIVLRTAHKNAHNHIDFGETHFFVGKNFIVAIRHGSTIAYTEVRARCESMPDLLAKGQSFVLYAIMDFIVDRYFPVVEELETDLEEIEEKVFKEKPNRKTTEQIYQLKREVLEVKRAVSPLIDICTRLMRPDIKNISSETHAYFRDVNDHALRINEMVDNTRELLNSALEANFSLISISQNDTNKKFAGWAAIIALPTMVAGFWGMNFRVMPQIESRDGFYIIIGLTALACVALFFLFKRSGWL